MNNETTSIGSLQLLGDFWTLRIIAALQDDELRYCGLQRAAQNVNPVTLTNRLKKLEDAGLVNRTEDGPDKNCVKYSLTSRGRQALPVLAAIDRFSRHS